MVYRICFFLCLLWVPTFPSQTVDPFEEDTLNIFYDDFVCDEKNIIETVGLSERCEGPRHSSSGGVTPPPPTTPCGTLLSPPSIPLMSVPNPNTDLIPFIFINNTGLPDSSIYIFIYGYPVISGVVGTGLEYVGFGSQPGPVTTTGVYVPVTASQTPPSTQYSYQLSNIPLTGGQRILYIPYLSSGIILFSFENPLDLVVSPGSIAVPIATDTSDSAYYTIYSGMELTFYPPGFEIDSLVQNQLTVDFTCVDYFGSPIYFNMFTQNPAPGLPQNRPSGIYQSRHYTLCSLQNTLATATSGNARTQWEGLILKNGSTVLRVISPGYSMTNEGGTFDAQYLDNAAAYGFSWANDVWTGINPYYGSGQRNTLQTVVAGDYGTAVYTGSINANHQFQFATTQVLFNQEVFTIPWVNVGSHDPSIQGTTAGIMRTGVVLPGMTYTSSTQTTPIDLSTSAGSAPPGVLDRATKITKYFCSAITASLIPGRVTSISTTGFLPNVIANYYSINTFLKSPGPITGPWYDLYSQGLLGNTAQNGNAVYTYTYDDYLYGNDPNLSVAPGQDIIDNTTNITVVLGPYTES